MCIGTILSELHLPMEYLLSLSMPKLTILYNESLRQRTNKAFMQMELLGLHRLKNESDRKDVIKGYQKLTNPFNISKPVATSKIESSWNTLRSR